MKYKIITHYISKDTDHRLYGRERINFAGNFEFNKSPRTTFVLMHLDEFDNKYISNNLVKPLKENEFIFRYTTDTIKHYCRPLIKINTEKSLIYFLTPESSEGITNKIYFESRGIKADFLNLILEDRYINPNIYQFITR